MIEFDFAPSMMKPNLNNLIIVSMKVKRREGQMKESGKLSVLK